MHKNAFQPKTLIGNWHENRFTDEYSEADNKTSNTYIKNPCKSFYPFWQMFSSQQVCSHLKCYWKQAWISKGKQNQK